MSNNYLISVSRACSQCEGTGTVTRTHCKPCGRFFAAGAPTCGHPNLPSVSLPCEACGGRRVVGSPSLISLPDLLRPALAELGVALVPAAIDGRLEESSAITEAAPVPTPPAAAPGAFRISNSFPVVACLRRDAWRLRTGVFVVDYRLRGEDGAPILDSAGAVATVVVKTGTGGRGIIGRGTWAAKGELYVDDSDPVTTRPAPGCPAEVTWEMLRGDALEEARAARQ